MTTPLRRMWATLPRAPPTACLRLVTHSTTRPRHLCSSRLCRRLFPARRHFSITPSVNPSSTPSSSPSSSSPPPSPATPQPAFLPPSLSQALASLSSFPEIDTALTHLSSSNPSLALPSLLRAYQILSRIPDSLPTLLTLRLLSSVYHWLGNDREEERVRAELVERTLGMKGEGEEGVVMRAQAAFAYQVMRRKWRRGRGQELTDRVLKEMEGQGGRLKANALVLSTLSADPSPATLDAYQEALALLSSLPLSSSLLSSYLDCLLNPGDVHLLLGDYFAHHHSPPSPSTAASHYQSSVSYYDSLPTPVLHLPSGQPTLVLSYPLAPLSLTSRAIHQTESHLDPDHPLMATALRFAAQQHEKEGDAIASEGLYRAAVARLERGGGGRAGKEELMETKWGYAQLLHKLTWNNRSRAHEGDLLIAQCQAMLDKDPGLSDRWQELQAGRPRAVPRWLEERFMM